MWQPASAFLKELEVAGVPAAINVIEPVHNGSERELVERFRDGDRDAFSALYKIHHAGVFRFALYMTGDRERAGEIAQEVFVWLIHHPAAFDPARGDLRSKEGRRRRDHVHDAREGSPDVPVAQGR